MVNFDWLKYCFHAYFLTWIAAVLVEMKTHISSPYMLVAVGVLMLSFTTGALIEVWKGGLPRQQKLCIPLD